MSWIAMYYGRFKSAKKQSDQKAWAVVDAAVEAGVLNMRLGGPKNRQQLFQEWSDKMAAEEAESAPPTVSTPISTPSYSSGGNDDLMAIGEKIAAAQVNVRKTLHDTFVSAGSLRKGTAEEISIPETKTCEECAEEIKFAAKKCRFCGATCPDVEELIEKMKSDAQADHENGESAYVQVLAADCDSLYEYGLRAVLIDKPDMNLRLAIDGIIELEKFTGPGKDWLSHEKGDYQSVSTSLRYFRSNQRSEPFISFQNGLAMNTGPLDVVSIEESRKSTLASVIETHEMKHEMEEMKKPRWDASCEQLAAEKINELQNTLPDEHQRLLDADQNRKKAIQEAIKKQAWIRINASVTSPGEASAKNPFGIQEALKFQVGLRFIMNFQSVNPTEKVIYHAEATELNRDKELWYYHLNGIVPQGEDVAFGPNDRERACIPVPLRIDLLTSPGVSKMRFGMKGNQARVDVLDLGEFSADVERCAIFETGIDTRKGKVKTLGIDASGLGSFIQDGKWTKPTGNVLKSAKYHAVSETNKLSHWYRIYCRRSFNEISDALYGGNGDIRAQFKNAIADYGCLKQLIQDLECSALDFDEGENISMTGIDLSKPIIEEENDSSSTAGGAQEQFAKGLNKALEDTMFKGLGDMLKTPSPTESQKATQEAIDEAAKIAQEKMDEAAKIAQEKMDEATKFAAKKIGKFFGGLGKKKK